MCYSGQCKYEDYMGDCNPSKFVIKDRGFPEDAACVEVDRKIEEGRKEFEKDKEPEKERS